MDPHIHDEEGERHKGHCDNRHREEEGMARQWEDRERRHEVVSGSPDRGDNSRRGGVAESGGGNRDEDYNHGVGARHDESSSHLQVGSRDDREAVSESGSDRCEGLHPVAELVSNSTSEKEEVHTSARQRTLDPLKS